MIIKMMILLIAIIGAFVNGVVGFFVWGICAYIIAILIGRISIFVSGGMIPRKTKVETATDFISQYSEIVEKAFHGKSSNEIKQNIGDLLETMMKESAAVHSNPKQALSKEYFTNVAMIVADEQPTEELKELARTLVWFLNTHRLWYGKD